MLKYVLRLIFLMFLFFQNNEIIRAVPGHIDVTPKGETIFTLKSIVDNLVQNFEISEDIKNQLDRNFGKYFSSVASLLCVNGSVFVKPIPIVFIDNQSTFITAEHMFPSGKCDQFYFISHSFISRNLRPNLLKVNEVVNEGGTLKGVRVSVDIIFRFPYKTLSQSSNSFEVFLARIKPNDGIQKYLRNIGNFQGKLSYMPLPIKNTVELNDKVIAFCKPNKVSLKETPESLDKLLKSRSNYTNESKEIEDFIIEKTKSTEVKIISNNVKHNQPRTEEIDIHFERLSVIYGKIVEVINGHFFTIDADVIPGCSGAPVFNLTRNQFLGYLTTLIGGRENQTYQTRVFMEGFGVVIDIKNLKNFVMAAIHFTEQFDNKRLVVPGVQEFNWSQNFLGQELALISNLKCQLKNVIDGSFRFKAAQDSKNLDLLCAFLEMPMRVWIENSSDELNCGKGLEVTQLEGARLYLDGTKSACSLNKLIEFKFQRDDSLTGVVRCKAVY